MNRDYSQHAFFLTVKASICLCSKL